LGTSNHPMNSSGMATGFAKYNEGDAATDCSASAYTCERILDGTDRKIVC